MDDKTFELYFQKHLISSLSREEELDCIVTFYITDDPQEKNICFRKLIRVTLRTVFNLAKKYRNKGIPLEELVSEGYNGLLKSVEKYNPFYEPQTRFKTFAYFYIKDGILEAFRKNKTAHGPFKFWGFLQSDDTEETSKELNKSIVSLDVLGKIPEYELKFKLINTRTPENDLIEKMEEEYLISRLKKVLDEKEFEIASYLVGLEKDQLTPGELAEKLDLTETRIYQLRNEIREKLISNGLVASDKNGNKRVVWE